MLYTLADAVITVCHASATVTHNMTSDSGVVEGVIRSHGHPRKSATGSCRVEIYFDRQSNITLTVRQVDLQEGDTVKIRVLDACDRPPREESYQYMTKIYFPGEMETISFYGNVLEVNFVKETVNAALFLLTYSGIIGKYIG